MMAVNYQTRRRQRHHSLLLCRVFAAILTCLIMHTSPLLCCSGVAALALPSECVSDPLAVSILQNSSMTFADKVALFVWNSNQQSRWWTAMSIYNLTHGNLSGTTTSGTVPLPPEPPHYCPQLNGFPTFAPGDFFPFTFDHSAVTNVMNATLEGVRCGLDCTSATSSPSRSAHTGDPDALREVLGMHEVTLVRNGTTYVVNQSILSNTTSVTNCIMSIPNTTAFDSVCVAYMQYNATYWENNTIFAFPTNGDPAILDENETAPLNVGRDWVVAVWLPPEVDLCPWYYTEMAETSQAWQSPSVDIQLHYTLRTTPAPTTPAPPQQPGEDPTTSSSVKVATATFSLFNWSCDVRPHHPTSGKRGARVRGVVQGYLVNYLIPIDFALGDVASYNFTLVNLRVAYFLNTLTVSTSGEMARGSMNTTGNGSGLLWSPPPAMLGFQGLMVPSLSAWRPLEDYTTAALANVPRRCYTSTPMTQLHEATTLYLPTLACSTGFVAMIVTAVNDTTFCCSVALTPSQQSAFVWPQFVEVFDTGVYWFTDTAGIVATPAPPRLTSAPWNASQVDNDNSNSGSSSSSSDAVGPTTPATSVVGDGENTALILGICLLAVGTVGAVMVAVYHKWWKPRQESGGVVAKNKVHQRETPPMNAQRGSSPTPPPLTKELGGRHDPKNRRHSDKPTAVSRDAITDLFFDEVEPDEDMEDL